MGKNANYKRRRQSFFPITNYRDLHSEKDSKPLSSCITVVWPAKQRRL